MNLRGLSLTCKENKKRKKEKIIPPEDLRLPPLRKLTLQGFYSLRAMLMQYQEKRQGQKKGEKVANHSRMGRIQSQRVTE